jgi:methylmalonyl-CoA/ethylmalonyl-CoA epimerase
MEFGLSQIGQIALTISEIDPAIAFYRDKLGLKFLFQAGNLGFFDCGGIRLMLTPAERPGESYSSILYFKVADLAQAHTEMVARGVAFESEPHLIARMPDHDLWMASFRDPDRNLLELMSELPRG